MNGTRRSASTWEYCMRRPWQSLFPPFLIMAQVDRYDVVLFGATGFTGKLVATYLNQHAGSPKWAISGRSKERLQGVKNALHLKEHVGILQADTNHDETLHEMARQAKCVINVVGPFRQSKGDVVVEACIAEGAHYVDLSGETGFNAILIQKFDGAARQKGVVIAPSCGLDSLPSDLTTYLAAKYLRQELQCSEVQSATTCLQEAAPFSAGTLLSACDMVDEDKRQLMFLDAGRLSTQKPRHEMQFVWSHWVPQSEIYAASYPLSPHNVRVSRCPTRSAKWHGTLLINLSFSGRVPDVGSFRRCGFERCVWLRL